MAVTLTITGTTGNDLINGTAANEAINGGAGNDTINGGAGNDTLTGDAGNDVLSGGDGNDGFFGGGGDDQLYGEAGDDTMYGDAGNDLIVGGGGNDKMYGGTGNDTLAGGAGVNTYDGGAGTDTFIIDIPAGGVTSAVRADLATLKGWMDGQLASAGSVAALSTQTAGPSLTLAALGLTISNIEGVTVKVDGVVTPIQSLINSAPVANASVALSTSEDTPVSGKVAASDADGDALSWSLSTTPTHGSVALDAHTGAYTYTPTGNWSGMDVFNVTVTDPSGATTIQNVSVTVAPVADMPVLTVANSTVTTSGIVVTAPKTSSVLNGTVGADTITGSKGNDVINGSGTVAISVNLDIASALKDTDGSEHLALKISNVPSGATLSAGTNNGDGSWSLTAAQLAGLKLSATVSTGFTLHVEATATESDGSKATAESNIDVILSPDANVLSGGSGNDTITGGFGNDTIRGGNGDDTLFGHGGDDTIYGGKGDDIISGGVGDNVLRGDSGNDTFLADAGNDKIYGGTGFDTLDYSSAASAITVDLSKKTVVGVASGNDTISSIEKIIGSSLADTFKGSTGNDIIDGGAGNDTLRGIAGSDKLTGGAGADTFFWEKSDVVSTLDNSYLGLDHITDFGAGDVLDFHKLVSLGTKALSTMIKVTDTSHGSTVSAKIGTEFKDIAVLDGVHGKSAADLFHDGQLLVG